MTMKPFVVWILAAGFSAACSSSPVKLYRAEILADDFDKDLHPQRFVLDDKGNAILLSYHRILSVADSKPLLEREQSSLSGFDRFREGLVFFQNGDLFALSGGKLDLLLETELNRLDLAADSDCIYFSGRIPKFSDEFRIFAFSPERGVRELCSLPEQPDALACGRGRLFFSVGPVIYSVDKEQRSRSEVVLPGATRIEALAFDEAERILYLSHGIGISALDFATGRIVLICVNAGAVDLRFVDGDLFALTEYPDRIVAFRQISRILRAQEANVLPWGG